MTAESSLLRAITARPDDPLPLDGYADWLDEYDRPGEAEFVRALARPDAIRPGSLGMSWEAHVDTEEVFDREATLAARWLIPQYVAGRSEVSLRGTGEVDFQVAVFAGRLKGRAFDMLVSARRGEVRGRVRVTEVTIGPLDPKSVPPEQPPSPEEPQRVRVTVDAVPAGDIDGQA